MRRRGPEFFADDLAALSREAAQRHEGIDVFVWPEGAISRHPRAPRNRAVLDLVRETGAEVWTGAGDLRRGDDGVRRSYNSAFRIFGDGEVDERYDKNILVPFGEFMPFAAEFPVLREIRGPGNFARGDGQVIYDGALARFAFLICYEAIRADYVREAVRKRPDLLVNLTFDAWFGDTSEPSQHLMLAAVQSAQYGVPMLRSTTTGISAIVDARGLITARTGVFTREVLVRDVAKVRVGSFYARAGDWFAWACVVAAAALLVAGRARRGPGLGVAVCAAAALIGCGSGTEPPRHFALITVDTLRADRLASYGGAPGLTPHLDALAEESQVFLRSYAPSSFTLPSVAAILTGRYPEALGIWKNESGLPVSAATLAAELRGRGWRTAAVVSNFVLRKSSGLAAGFDLFDDALPQREAVRKWPERIAADTTAAALQVLADCTAGTDARCFLWVHYQDPHGPYTPPGDRRERFLAAARAAADGGRSLPLVAERVPFGGIPPYQYLDGRSDVAFYRAGYDAEVQYVDEEIGRLLDGLFEHGLADRMLLVFAADHGESLGEADYWFAHGELLTDPLVRVPLLIRDPALAPRRRDDPVSLVDLFPTALARLAGAPPDPDRPGRDLLAEGAEDAASTPYLASLGASSVARYGLVDGDFKLLVAERDGAREERFHREGSGEVDLLSEAPAIAAAMLAKLGAIRAEMAQGPVEIRQPLSPAEREKLRALGYATEP
jgi:arylsulfatase A-like enzyme/predicted amidohydrolase